MEKNGRVVSYGARIIHEADRATSIVHLMIAGDCPHRLALDMLKNCLPIVEARTNEPRSQK